MTDYYDSETNKYVGIEEGMIVKSWRGVDTEVFFEATHWDKTKPLLSDGDPPDGFFQWLQVRDMNTDELYWIRSYPSWIVIGEK